MTIPARIAEVTKAVWMQRAIDAQAKLDALRSSGERLTTTARAQICRCGHGVAQHEWEDRDVSSCLQCAECKGFNALETRHLVSLTQNDNVNWAGRCTCGTTWATVGAVPVCPSADATPDK